MCAPDWLVRWTSNDFIAGRDFGRTRWNRSASAVVSAYDVSRENTPLRRCRHVCARRVIRIVFIVIVVRSASSVNIVKRFTTPSATVIKCVHTRYARTTNNSNKTEILYRNCEDDGPSSRGRRSRYLNAVLRPRFGRVTAYYNKRAFTRTAEWNAIGYGNRSKPN